MLELVRLLGEYRDDIVVVGGWVPELLLPDLQPQQRTRSRRLDRERVGQQREDRLDQRLLASLKSTHAAQPLSAKTVGSRRLFFFFALQHYQPTGSRVRPVPATPTTGRDVQPVARRCRGACALSSV